MIASYWYFIDAELAKEASQCLCKANNTSKLKDRSCDRESVDLWPVFDGFITQWPYKAIPLRTRLLRLRYTQEPHLSF